MVCTVYFKKTTERFIKMMVLSSRSRSEGRPASPLAAVASCWSWSCLLIFATSLCSSSAFNSSPTRFGPKRHSSRSFSSLLRQEELAVITEGDPLSPIGAADPSTSVSVPASIVNRPDDLTSQELALRFQDVLAYFASVPLGDPSIAHFTDVYTPQLSLLRGRLDDVHLARCCVLPSTIPGSGNGLFASRNIEKGELVTLFPGDAILFRDGELEEITGAMFGILPRQDETSISLTDDAARAYEIRSSSKHSIVGDPSRTDDFAYLGHVANDGAILTKGDDLSRTVYSSKSANAANAAFQDIHEGCHIGLFAMQPIRKGQEIFVSYGEGYWLSRGSNDLFQESQKGDAKRGRRVSVAATTTRENRKGKSSKPSGRGF
jgi:hypothetical protein